jgi:hypothetical protein
MRILRILTPVLVAVVLTSLPVEVSGAGAAAGPAACSGTGSFGPSGPPTVQTSGGETFVAFAFDGAHPYCSTPGVVDAQPAVLSGNMTEHVTADGNFDLQFLETMTLADGSSDQWQGTATGTISPSGLPVVSASEVRTVGVGTGQLEGVEGHGSFQITGFGGYGFTFADTIYYVYAG